MTRVRPSESSVFPPSLAAIDGVVVSPSMFSDRPALWVNGHEIAHFDGHDRMDVRLTRAVIRATRPRLRAEPRIHLRSSSSADWLEVHVEGAIVHDPLVHELVERAAAAHRAPPGIHAEPPPTGPALERRRRFH